MGQFFPDSPDQLDEFMGYIEGRTQVPLPTYFIGDYGVGAPKVLLAASKDSANRGFKLDGLKVCENLYWLKGSGKFAILGMFVFVSLIIAYCRWTKLDEELWVLVIRFLINIYT